MKKSKKNLPPIPDLTEFTDANGKRWIQTSADDLLANKELVSLLDYLEKEKTSEDIVVARIDFHKVNKEYYEEVADLQARLEKQNKMLKNLLLDAKATIDKKNRKLRELVDYIKKLHLFVAYNNDIKPEEIKKMLQVPMPVAAPVAGATEELVEKKIVVYSDVEEIMLNEEGKETRPVRS